MKSPWAKLARGISFAIFIGWTIQVAQAYGIREKTFWEKFHDIIVSGIGGALFGWIAFGLIGAVGLVAGPLYGAIGLLSFFGIGTAAGLGIGSLYHVLTHHEDFVFSYDVIVPVLIAGSVVSWLTSQWLGRWVDSWPAPDLSLVTEKATVVIERPKPKILRPVLNKTVRISPPESSRQLPGDRGPFLH